MAVLDSKTLPGVSVRVPGRAYRLC